MDTRDFSQATIEEIYDIIEKLKEQGSLWDSIQDYWCISDPSAGELSNYAAKGDLETYYQQHADKMDLTKKKFGKIVENVRDVDYKYQKEFTKCNEELKTFQETLKNLTEEISLRTVSLDSDSYKHAAEILEGNDEVKKQKLKELIGVKPGESKESRMAQKIQEILKYSIGEGTFEDEIDPESKEASISQKKKLIQEIERIKEQFRSGKLTQEEVIDQICELYRIEDYGSKINYSLAVKKYQPEKKARIVSDILSTVLYIVEKESLNAEQIKELSQTVKAKSYISDEMWSMAENAFRGAVVGANTAIAGKYYAGVEESKNRNGDEDGSGVQVIHNRYPGEPQAGWEIDYTIENGKIHVDNGVQNVDFVIDMDGNLHIGSGHSYLANGADVQAAGTLKINSQGYVRTITNASGHYAPAVEQGRAFPNMLNELGIRTQNAWLELGDYSFTPSGYVDVTHSSTIVEQLK